MAKFTETPLLGERFQSALNWAFELHQKQVRKNGTPYFAHLMAVSSLVVENGGSEDEAIAALLHDIVEDIGVEKDVVREKFGADVADIIDYLSEDKSLEKKARKEDYVHRLSYAPDSTVLVSAADKLHNLRCYLQDYKLIDLELVDFYHQLILRVYSKGLDFRNPIRNELESLFEKQLKPHGEWLLKEQFREVLKDINLPGKPEWVDDSHKWWDGAWQIVPMPISSEEQYGDD